MIPVLENVDAGGKDAQRLIAALDQEIVRRYPGDPVNGINVEEFRAASGYFVVAREPESQEAVACGAFRPVTRDCVEIKRMFVDERFRRRGLARQVLTHLEEVARNRGFKGFILETATGQPEAMALYERLGYFRIPRFGAYANSEKSVCYVKQA